MLGYSGRGWCRIHDSFAFRRKIRKEKPSRNDKLSELERNFRGEYSIFVQNAQWEVFRINDSIADCTDNNFPNGRMFAGLNLLIDNVVVSSEVTQNSENFIINFLRDLSLVVYCDDICLDATCYKLWFEGECICNVSCKSILF